MSKATRRSKIKNPALDPRFMLKNRQELIDYDYLHKLSDEELKFLNTFTEEFVGARLNHPGDVLHNSKELKKDCFDRNNARNRDIFTRAKVDGSLDYLEDLYKEAVSVEDEDELPTEEDDISDFEENS